MASAGDPFESYAEIADRFMHEYGMGFDYFMKKLTPYQIKMLNGAIDRRTARDMSDRVVVQYSRDPKKLLDSLAKKSKRRDGREIADLTPAQKAQFNIRVNENAIKIDP